MKNAAGELDDRYNKMKRVFRAGDTLRTTSNRRTSNYSLDIKTDSR
jgi:hypothetical protein